MTSAGPAHDRFPAGHRIASRYTVASVLGEGVSGVVYLAHRDDDGRRVALKVIHRHLSGNRQIFQRYHREAAILKRVEGPHVARMLDFIEESGLLVIALEHIDGTSLEEVLRDHAPLDADRTIEIGLQICAALEAAHAAGVVHRDLKPANVLLERPLDGQSGAAPALAGRVRVVDFGLAKVVHGEQMTTGLTEQDMVFGTPEYMAPEQARGEDVDPRCDIYALGCMLYEMAVGVVPFRKRTPIAVMTAHLTEEPLPPRLGRRDGGISSGLEAVILRALSKTPAERYPSARLLADALRACRERRVVAQVAASVTDAMSTTELQLGRTGLDHAAAAERDHAAAAERDHAAAAERDHAAAAHHDLAAAAQHDHAAAAQRDAGPPDIRPLHAVDLALARTLSAGEAAATGAPLDGATPNEGRSRERLLWIVVAVLFATIGATVGTLFGAR